MATRPLFGYDAKWVWAVPAVLMGCNAILDNPEGDLDSAGGSVSIGGHTGTTGGGPAFGGATGTVAASSVGGSAALGGSASVGGTAGGMGGSQTVGGALSGTTGGDSTLGGATSVGGNPAIGGNLNVGGDGAGGLAATGGNAATSATMTGGANAIGGAGALGGGLGSGGVNASGGTASIIDTVVSGGAATIGGGPGSGGAATGGVNASGGAELGGAPTSGGAATGGVPATGGDASAGGIPAVGGAATGGAPATGGVPATGGAATGGAATGGAATGGIPATGGASSIVGPGVVFSYATVNDAATTNLTTATFQFSSVPSGAAASYKCKFNGEATFTDCTSQRVLTQLASGGQILTVHALDSGGHVGPDATRSWTVAPLSTTIKAIRANSASYDDYLVSVSTNVRVTGFGTESSNQVIFVQEAGPAAALRVDALADIAGNTVLNSGILTRALTTQTARAEGTPVTVIGTVAHNGSSQELVRATYIWGTGTVIPYIAPQVRTSTVFAAGLEAVRIELAGRIPASNCSSSCFNSLIGNSNRCIETVCIDSGCGTNKIVTWLDITGGASPPITTDYGAWMGWLVKRNSYYELWTDSSNDNAGSDLCM